MSSDNIPGWFTTSLVVSAVFGAVIKGLERGLTSFVTDIQTTGTKIRTELIKAGLAVEADFANVGDALLGVQRTFRSVFIDVGLTGGIAAPISVAVLTVVSFGMISLVVTGLVVVVKAVIPP